MSIVADGIIPPHKFDMITMTSYYFSVLSPDQRKKILHTSHTLLSEYGVVVLDASSLKVFRELHLCDKYTVVE